MPACHRGLTIGVSHAICNHINEHSAVVSLSSYQKASQFPLTRSLARSLAGGQASRCRRRRLRDVDDAFASAFAAPDKRYLELVSALDRDLRAEIH